MHPLRDSVVLPRVYAAFDDQGQLREPWHGREAAAVLDGVAAMARRVRPPEVPA